MRLRSALAVVVTVLSLLAFSSTSLAAAGTSLAGNADAAQYSQPVVTAPEQAGSSQPLSEQQQVSQQGGLPFTGYAMIIALVAGLSLTGAGVLVRRHSG